MTAVITPSSTSDERDRILDALAAASRELARSTPRARAALLNRIAERVEAASAELVPIAVAETGLGPERLAGEVARTANQFRLAARVVEDGSWLEVSIDHAAPPFDDHRRMNIPLGPVLVFAASNFPFAFGVLGTDTASALAAGCAVVAKGHPGHPRLAARLAVVMDEALEAAGAPAELFALVEGDAATVVLRDERIAAGSFTGSIRGGVALLEIARARPRPIPFFAEMGSVNPVIITEAAWAARQDDIMAGFVASMTQSNGQLCTSPGLVFVPATGGLEATIVTPLVTAGAAPLLTDAIADSFRAGVAELAETAGVSALTPMVITNRREAATMIWSTSATTVLEHPGVLEERFGPSSVLVQYEHLEKTLDVIHQLPGQLTGSIFCEPGEDVSAITEALVDRVGRVLHNAWPTGVAVSWSMHHGGPWPASSSIASGSVGAEAISRFLRPVTYQNIADEALPDALRESNPWGLPRRVDGVMLARP